MTLGSLLILTNLAWGAGNPIPSDDRLKIDQNFRDMESEIRKIDPRQGMTFSSNVVFNASVTINGGLFSTINRSSETRVSGGQSWTNTSFGACIISTVTLTVDSAARVRVTGWLQAGHNTAGEYNCFTVLQDGVQANGAECIATNATQRTVDDPGPVVIHWIFANPGAGSHSYCIAPKVSAGTGQIQASIGSFTFSHRFRAEEVH